MSADTINFLASLLRLLVLAYVLYSSVRYRDLLGVAITVLWSVAILFNLYTDWKYTATILATPLVYLVAWGIIKRQRKG